MLQPNVIREMHYITIMESILDSFATIVDTLIMLELIKECLLFDVNEEAQGCFSKRHGIQTLFGIQKFMFSVEVIIDQYMII